MPAKRSSKKSKSSGTKKIKKRASAPKRSKSASKARATSRTKPKRSSRPASKSRAKRPVTAAMSSSSRSKSVGGGVSVSRIAAGATRGVPKGMISKHEAAKAAARGKAKMVARAAAAQRGSQGMLELEEGPPAVELVRDPSLGPPPMPKKRRKGSQINMLDFPGDSLTVGMAAPEFSLPSTLGRRVTLSEFRGKRVILYFYPKDDTPGCTMEACGFRDSFPRIESKDAVVLGISLDDELSHEKFAQKYNLPFPLLSDKDAAVSRQYGTYKEKSLYGRSFWGIERTTFVIDREGRVEHVFRRVKVEGHAEEVMATLAL